MVDRVAAIWCSNGCDDAVEDGRITGLRCGAVDVVDQGLLARTGSAAPDHGTVRRVAAR